MAVEYSLDQLDISTALATLLDELSVVTDYRTLRDNLPRRLTGLLRCRCVLLYQRLGETLQLASGSFADQPGWSAALLAVAHINPIEAASELPEAQAWRTRRAIVSAHAGQEAARISAPLIYRQRAIGVLVALRGQPTETMATPSAPIWQAGEGPLVAVVANVVAMLLENTRLLERDRERIHELSLLNGITSQMNSGLRERERVEHILLQRAREIALPDLCTVLSAELDASGQRMAGGEQELHPAPTSAPSWLPPRVQQRLLTRWRHDLHAPPLMLERGSNQQSLEYMEELDPRIKTFFALPLIGKRGGEQSRLRPPFASPADEQSARVLGILVGAYHKSWQLRREEQMLLQILTNQASAVLENIRLMDAMLEARNEARRLLRQVLDDQRFKELVLASVPSGLITIDLREAVVLFNQAAEAVLGYHPREIIGQPIRKLLDLRGLERCLQGGQPQHETLMTTGRQGQELALDVTLIPLRDERGVQAGVLMTFADITSIYRLEEEKRRLDRLASLGEMSANVAHEVRNPLAAIKTSMQMLRDELRELPALETGAFVQEEIAVVFKELERLDGIVRDLLYFARPRQLHRVACDLDQLVARQLQFLRPQCEERGIRVVHAPQSVPPILVDIGQIEQVLMNILLNAIQAMPDGGLLTASCQLLSLPCATLASHNRLSHSLAYPELFNDDDCPALSREQSMVPEQTPQTWLELAISDTGVGIAREALERIFQPFYTTKAHGIGLGLPITRRLIEDHQGSILVESQLGYGTTISVRLPVASSADVAGRIHGREEGPVS